MQTKISIQRKIHISGRYDRISGTRSIEKEVSGDLLPRIITYISHNKTIKNDDNYIKNVILPPFMDLRVKWPEGYDLLMKGNFQISIIDYKSDLFELCATYTNEDKVHRNPSFVLNFYPDKSVIFIAKNGNFSASFLEQSIYRQIMHIIDNFAIKEDKSKHKNKKIYFLSYFLDKLENPKLSVLAKNYILRVNSVANKFEEWRDKNKYCNKDEILKFLINLMNENSCWAYIEPDEGDADLSLSSYKYFFLFPHDAQNMLAYGLSFYFGTPEQKKRLKKHEPGLYLLIEKSVLPHINKKEENSLKIKMPSNNLFDNFIKFFKR